MLETSARLLSLLQTHRNWSGAELTDALRAQAARCLRAVQAT
ncbi:hypothetical protein [Streptosporangium sp. KLBMP 9127]